MIIRIVICEIFADRKLSMEAQIPRPLSWWPRIQTGKPVAIFRLEQRCRHFSNDLAEPIVFWLRCRERLDHGCFTRSFVAEQSSRSPLPVLASERSLANRTSADPTARASVMTSESTSSLPIDTACLTQVVLRRRAAFSRPQADNHAFFCTGPVSEHPAFISHVCVVRVCECRSYVFGGHQQNLLPATARQLAETSRHAALCPSITTTRLKNLSIPGAHLLCYQLTISLVSSALSLHFLSRQVHSLQDAHVAKERV